MPRLGSVRPPRLVGAAGDLRPRGRGAGRGWGALAAGGRRLLQRDPGAGPDAAWAVGRCESGRGGAGTRRLYRGPVVPHRSLPSYPTQPQSGGLAADPGAGGGDPGWERGCDLRIPSGYLENKPPVTGPAFRSPNPTLFSP